MDDVQTSYGINLDEAVSQYTLDEGVVSFSEIEHRNRDHLLRHYEKNMDMVGLQISSKTLVNSYVFVASNT